MTINEQLVLLTERYSKANIEKGIFPFVKRFYSEIAGLDKLDNSIKDILQKIILKKPINKSEMAAICFSVFMDENIYKQFLSTLPSSITTLIERLLWVDSMGETDIELLINDSITVTTGLSSYSRYKELKNEYHFFTVNKFNYSWSSTDGTYFVLSLDAALKEILIPYYPKPINYNFIPLDEIPKTHYRFNVESIVMSELPRVLTYYLQGGIKYAAKGKPLDGTLNKLNRSCAILEFLPNQDNLLGKVRTALIAGMLYNFKLNNISIDNAATIKELFTKQYFQLHTAQFILMQIKGWGYVDSQEYVKGIETILSDLIKALPTDKWISTKNLIGYIESRSLKLKPISDSASAYRLYYDKTIEKNTANYVYDTKIFISGKVKLLVTLPFIKGTIFLYAAFGLFEIAYEDVDVTEYTKTYNSPYDGLLYFKLTTLGRYVLGHTKEYAGSVDQQRNKLQLSEDSLMILAEGDMSVIDIMLANFAEKAGSNRYKVSHAHFLKNCQTAGDIEKKVAVFKRTISEKLPAYWINQFDTWQKNAFKVNERLTTLVFKIASDDKQLQKLIAQDPILKELILKAEQFHILVEQRNASKFKSRMKELSYLVE